MGQHEVRRWLAANGGPLAVVLVGVYLAGIQSRALGLAVIVFGVGYAIVSRRRPEQEASIPAPQPLLVPAAPELGPDIRILSLHESGGGGGYVDFTAELANYGTRQSRCEIRAFVGETAVEVRPQATIDLIPDTPPVAVRVIVPRPKLGDLVPDFNHESTLYGATLRLEATDDTGRSAAREWREVIYDPSENLQRHQIQQREWRIGRGEATDADNEADMRAEWLRARTKRMEEQ
jgi:hypothetical protein